MTSGIDVIKAVEGKIANVRTKSLDLSFNELLDMYENAELIINPEYQRLFRWSEGQQSRFIESLLLEMPIPPIFVIEREEGVYELIDGLQRISSYLHFRGHLKMSEENEDNLLVLTDCDIVGELNGLSYEDLPPTLKIKLKRNYVRVEILRKESDQRLRYYMFKRLNTGGEVLTEQEIRNCTIRLLNNTFIDFINEMSKDEHFQASIENVSDEKLEQRYGDELVLRFFAFKNWRHKYTHDVASFMTDFMESVTDPEINQPFDYDKERQIFKKTFDVISKTLSASTFANVKANGKYGAKFLIYHFEAYTLGIQSYLDQINVDDNVQLKLIKQVFTDIKHNTTFKKLTSGGGKNYGTPLNERINFVESRIGNIV